MIWPDSIFYPHTVTVRDYQPGGGMGPGYGAPRTIPAEVKDEQRMVRDADGVEVVSSTQVTVKVAANVPVGSLVTVWAGKAGEREAQVLAVGRNENPDDLDDFLVLSLE